MRNLFAATILLGAVLSAGAATAEPEALTNSNALWFENWTTEFNATLKVVAPNGELHEVTAASGTPVFELRGSAIEDGVYVYELSAATAKVIAIVNPQNNGRGDAARDTQNVGITVNGQFIVSRGVIQADAQLMQEEG
jgi:hypothetical protein